MPSVESLADFTWQYPDGSADLPNAGVLYRIRPSYVYNWSSFFHIVSNRRTDEEGEEKIEEQRNRNYWKAAEDWNNRWTA